jgi:diguanylate cyclase (GGDEF)-like protein
MFSAELLPDSQAAKQFGSTAASPIVQACRTNNLVTKLSDQLSAIEKRDTDVWVFTVLSGALIGLGLLVVLFPATFLTGGSFHFELQVSKNVFFGLLALMIVSNTYLAARRFELRSTRQQLISQTIQGELVRLQSFTDPLTEVYNRRSLEEMAGRYISQARRFKTRLLFMLVDLDRFKQINTQFGHLTGDLVLAEFAALIKAAVRGSDSIVRYGGDEFLLILPGTGLEDGRAVESRINDAIEGWNCSGVLRDFKFSFSLGIAEWKDGMTLDEVLDEADKAMYARKNVNP